jgi:two-component system, sensor histidine kinase and response regulator
MARSRLFWQLAGTSLLLVIVPTALPGWLGTPAATVVVLGLLVFAWWSAALLIRRSQRLADSVQAALGESSSASPSTEPPLEFANLDQAIYQLVQQHQALQTQVEHERQVAKQAREAGDVATSARNDFLAILSHEIRTPLNGILGMTQLALQTQLDSQQREYLEIVRSSGEFLLAVVNDMREFARREAGRVPSPMVRFPLRATLAETAKLLGLRAQQKGLELLVRTAPDIPDVLEGDPDRLRQLLVNLLTNAIAFTDHGEVVVSVSRVVDSGSKTEIALSASLARTALHFQVQDTGIGIPEDKLPSLIPSLPGVRPPGSSGLGLTIARQLADGMGGSLWAESTPGKGSTFHFTATFQLSREPGSESPPGNVEPGCRALLVDDNATSRQILAELMESWQIRAVSVASSDEALSVLEQAQNDPFALTVIDARMPQTDGFALVEKIRQRPQTVSLPILMLITAVPPEDAVRCRQMPISAHLMKPVHPGDLLQAVQKVVNVRQTSPILPPAKPAAPMSLRVLVADANPANRQLVVVVLEKLGHTTRLASTGQEASRLLAENDIDLLLLDPNLPDPPGLEIVASLRAREKQEGGHLPILALLAYGMTEDRERCRAAGVDGYLAKPLQLQELVRAIETVRPVSG